MFLSVEEKRSEYFFASFGETGASVTLLLSSNMCYAVLSRKELLPHEAIWLKRNTKPRKVILRLGAKQSNVIPPLPVRFSPPISRS